VCVLLGAVIQSKGEVADVILLLYVINFLFYELLSVKKMIKIAAHLRKLSQK